MIDPSDGADGRTVVLPEHVASEIERRLPATRFDSVDAYAGYALEVLLRELAAGEDDREPEEPDADAVRDRLESLGYL